MVTIYDSSAFIDGLLKHLLHCPEMIKRAQELEVTGDDFITDDVFGIRVYKLLVDTILKIKHVPIAQGLLIEYLRVEIDDSPAFIQLTEPLINLVVSLYTALEELNVAYHLAEFKPFIKHRRLQRAKVKHEDDLEQLAAAVTKVSSNINKDSWAVSAERVYPFRSLLEKPVYTMVPTGYTSLDTILGGGLGYGEYGLLIGHSGAGKTALAVNLAYNAVLLGKKVIYFSMEDTIHNVVNRFYSRAYKIQYTLLHNGNANLELTEKWDTIDPVASSALKQNLAVDSLVGVGMLNCDQLYTRMLDHYEKDGFLPDLVIVDQFQFIQPIANTPNDASWDKDKITSEELDQLSHKAVADKRFGLWVLHQAKGSPKARYNTSDLQGYKGIIQKADNVFCLGREKLTSDECIIFSLKCRHAKNFELKFQAELEFMTISEPSDYLGGNGATETSMTSPTSVAKKDNTETSIVQEDPAKLKQIFTMTRKVEQFTGPPQYTPAVSANTLIDGANERFNTNGLTVNT
jgi:hypothetical protein